MTETAYDILGKHRPVKKPWVTDDVLKLYDKRRELKRKKKEIKGAIQFLEKMAVDLCSAEDLSRLPIPKGQVMSPLECGLRALLVTSQGLVRTYEYKHREAGTHGVLSDVTLDWFLDPYDHN